MAPAISADSRNFKLIIEYDGSDYHGWQRQARDRSIQQEIETALRTMTGRSVTLFGSGRTDAGVHALGQAANFHCMTRMTPDALQKGLNSLLPLDIVIRECAPVPSSFHARYAAKSKRYRYAILNSPLRPAVGRAYVWWIRAPLDLASMREALPYLIGVHDFRSFEGTGSPRQHTVRHVTQAELETGGDGRILFHIEANGFLRFMVRNIVGTLVMIGQGKMAPQAIEEILSSRDRRRAGATAPAQGLCLMQVNY